MLTCEELKDIKNEIKFFLNEITLNKDSVFSSDDADDFLNEFGNTLPFFYDYAYGETRLVIIPKDKKYVIKIPFNYTYDGYKFENRLSITGMTDNYCEVEEELYKIAEQHHYEFMFMPLYQVSFSPYPVYIQEKAEILADLKEFEDFKNTYASKKSLEEIKSLPKKNIFILSNLDRTWRASCLDTLGSFEEYQKFYVFLQDTGISSDLHEFNIGYFHGKPVIIDYASYNE